jgi:predicted O-methyltransferase YrrM
MPQHPLYTGSLARMSFRVPIDESITALLDEIAETPEWVGASNAGVLSLLYSLVIGCGLRNVLQLGTYVGYSSLVLGDAARRIGGRLITLDPDERAMGIARGYLTRAGLETHVRTVLKASTDPDAIAEIQTEAPFDLVYIDSLHDYACTRKELPAYWPLLRPAGFLCMDDADEAAARFDTKGEGGVLRAIKEWLPTVRDCEWIMMRQPSWDPVGCLLATKVPSGKELVPRLRGLVPSWLKRSLSRANGPSG